MNVEQKLREMGLVLPTPPKPVAAYVPSVRSGNLLYVSGQIPFRDGKLIAIGKVPSAVSIEQGKAAAAQCALNGLAILGVELGGNFDRLVRVVRLGAFVQCDNGFDQQPQVANGASELLVNVLGEIGRHARAAVGANALPLNAAVEVEFLFEVR
jgi:enamine deaminase RidA (YjgF/YER057c/UK114 family)